MTLWWHHGNNGYVQMFRIGKRAEFKRQDRKLRREAPKGAHARSSLYKHSRQPVCTVRPFDFWHYFVTILALFFEKIFGNCYFRY